MSACAISVILEVFFLRCARRCTAIVVLLLAISLLAGAATALSAPEAEKAPTTAADQKPYFIIHLDAVSSKVFFEMYDAGRLPNIARLFADGVVIPHAVSPFMAGTEMIYPRMRQGVPISSHDPVSWTTLNRHTGEYLTYFENVWGLWRWVPRYALGQAIAGIPGFEGLSRLSMANFQRILRDYGVVEFFWFVSDGIGHYKGIEAQKSSVIHFDSMLTPLVRYVENSPDSLNVVLYCDHGMSMTEEFVFTEEAMAEVAGDRAVLCSYPNVYLVDESYASEVAKALADRYEVDFAFWRDGESRIVGHHSGGGVIFDYDDERVAYSHDGIDPFGYCDLGYSGEALSDSEWLDLTCCWRWPAVPVQIVRYMENDYSGHVIVVTNPPKSMPSPTGFIARHKGLSSSDCTVPVLMRGPDINLNPVPESIWLQTLHREVLGIDSINSLIAEREPNSLLVSPSGVRLGLSPAPSLMFQMGLDEDLNEFVCEVDAFRSYNVRLWLGAGMATDKAYSPLPCGAFSTRAELFAGRIALDWRTLHFGHDTQSQVSARYEAESGITVRWAYPVKFSIGVTW